MSRSAESRTMHERTWILRWLLVFLVAAAAGIGLLGARWAVLGNADPFAAGPPFYLWIGTFVLTLACASLGRSPLAAAFGLFVGLIVTMLVDGRAEYPAAAVIACAIHGLAPALAAAALSRAIQATRRSTNLNAGTTVRSSGDSASHGT